MRLGLRSVIKLMFNGFKYKYLKLVLLRVILNFMRPTRKSLGLYQKYYNQHIYFILCPYNHHCTILEVLTAFVDKVILNWNLNCIRNYLFGDYSTKNDAIGRGQYCCNLTKLLLTEKSLAFWAHSIFQGHITKKQYCRCSPLKLWGKRKTHYNTICFYAFTIHYLTSVI